MRLPIGQSKAVGRSFIDLGPEVTAAVMTTVEEGWKIALGYEGFTVDTDEVTITECLRDGMRQALVELRMPWRKTMIVAPGTESRSIPSKRIPDGRTDIPLFLTRVFARSGEHDPHAIVECKRVAEQDAGLAREYVVEGIDRFRTGKYAENHKKGFMVGYVIAGSARGVVDAVNCFLARKSRSTEVLNPQAGGRADGWTSRHPRASKGDVDLHHAMLIV